jgi:hypothetical protein
MLTHALPSSAMEKFRQPANRYRGYSNLLTHALDMGRCVKVHTNGAQVEQRPRIDLHVRELAAGAGHHGQFQHDVRLDISDVDVAVHVDRDVDRSA